MTIFTVVFLGFCGFFMLVEQHQPNTGETDPFPTLHASNLFDSRLYLRNHRKENCVTPYTCTVYPDQGLPHKQEIPSI